ncbi:MAG: 30S ribosomal protein S20 [Bdellovibrionaceae bacterium]|nr:30S ribosomal protein S20 [Pseudobdellovibrionaceae bacterium]MDW8190493.1 30S ribosomal protein S20 [Pseudobdellovibrionaceae bacterium]
MANHKSCEKRARQAKKRAFRNSVIKSSLKTLEKRLIKAASTKAQETPQLLSRYTASIMKAVAKGTLKKHTMARKLSRVQTRVNHLLQSAQSSA